MMRHLIVAAWATAVALAASYATTAMREQTGSQPNATSDKVTLEAVKIRLVSVPVIAQGVVQGYVLSQLVFMVDKALYRSLPGPQEVYLTDEVFKAVYNGDKIDFQSLQKQKLSEFAQALKESVNRRFSGPVVRDVLVQEMNYVSKREARGGR